jgi:hypothetical protein
MIDREHQPKPELFKTQVWPIFTAVIGLLVAAISLIGFVLDLLVTPEVGELIVSFVVCGLGLAIGFFMLRRLARRQEPISLFAGLAVTSAHGAMPTEVSTQRAEWPPGSIKSASRVHNDAAIAPVMRSHGSESIATRKTHDSGGMIAAIATIGMGSLLMGFSWQFLFFAVLAGGLVALVLYWVRSRQESSISGYKMPVAGGIVGVLSLAGVGLVMMRFQFLRVFLGLAMGAGGAIALVLYRNRQRQNADSSFIQLHAESSSFSRTMRIE